MAYTPIYTSISAVRNETGTQLNTDIDDDINILPKIAEAEGMINSCLAKYYILPLSNNPLFIDSSAQGFLLGLATRLSAALVLLAQYEGQGVDLQEIAQEKYDLAKIDLQKLCKGEISLIGEDGNIIEKNFSNNNLQGYPNSIYDKDNNYNSQAKFKIEDIF